MELDCEGSYVAIFDHPSNPHHPTSWHTRDYGQILLNPCGQNAFDPRAAENVQKPEPDLKLEFRGRVVIPHARRAERQRGWILPGVRRREIGGRPNRSLIVVHVDRIAVVRYRLDRLTWSTTSPAGP